MERVEREVIQSLETEAALLPDMPALLADLDALGSSPSIIADLAASHVRPNAATRVLDLACGKGPVALALARRFGCSVLGVDGFAPFVDAARAAARRSGLGRRCAFERGDLRSFLAPDQPYDLVILASVGDLLGDPSATMAQLRRAARPGGWIVIDDGFKKAGAPDSVPGYGHAETVAGLTAHGDVLTAEAALSDGALRAMNDANNRAIDRRVDELSARHPARAALFRRYQRRQREECRLLETAFTCAVWLLRRAPGTAGVSPAAASE